MFDYGYKSREVLKTLHPNLRLLMWKVIKKVNVSLIEGIRPQHEQNEYYDTGKSKVQYPDSKHNRTDDPQLIMFQFDISDAVDLVPYPTLYSDSSQMLLVAGIVLAIASEMGIELKWGGDWNDDGSINNKPGQFFDPYHFELIHK